jgi:hypothetical protein
MDRAERYLRIPVEYVRSLGSLTWAANAQTIDFGDGTTFVFSQALAPFLDSFRSQRSPIAFGFVLHLLRMLKGPPLGENFARLRTAFEKTCRRLRHAGVFCALLCRDVPAAPDPPSAQEVWQRLSTQPRLPRRAPDAVAVVDSGASDREPSPAAEVPPLSPAQFEAVVLRRLNGYSDEEMEHWLRRGCAPLGDEGERLARAALQTPPRTLAAVLDDLARRRRLAGAAPYVAQLLGALSLPPRRLARPELPLGGYADLATRGGPEQILPLQFALDDLEFLRRFAQRELLYYQREEPADPVREELLVLLDQGVRTWGEVRLMLAAALLALGRMAGRRRLALRWAATSDGGAPRDPLAAGADDLADLLEASDLSVNPGAALERVLEEKTTAPRDVVLLTHPLSLEEPDVTAAARRLRPGHRLFALAVDEERQAAFHEVRRGAPIEISRFRLSPPPPEPPPEPAAATVAPADLRRAWTGPVERVGFPFQLGLAGGGPLRLAFDHAGDWLLAARRHGMLCLMRTDGSHIENLPRGLYEGRAASVVHQVLGVAGGFLLCATAGDRHVLLHYDLGRRSVAARLFGSGQSDSDAPFECWYSRSLHAAFHMDEEDVVHCLHLATGRGEYLADHGVIPDPTPPGGAAFYSWLRHQSDGEPTHPRSRWVWPVIFFNPETGAIRPHHVTPSWMTFTPVADNRPLLKGRILVRGADCQGQTLAAVFEDPRTLPPQRTLRLFRGPRGVPAGEFDQPASMGAFALSSDGRLLARQAGLYSVEVRDVLAGGRPQRLDAPPCTPETLNVYLGERWLALSFDNHSHLVRWDSGRLIHGHTRGGPEFLKVFIAHTLGDSGLSSGTTPALPGRLPADCCYDEARFKYAAWGNVIAVVDVFGQVALFSHAGDLVCMFFAFEEHFAAWAPGGHRSGSPRLLGGPPTPDAEERIGRRLQEAWVEGEGVITTC